MTFQYTDYLYAGLVVPGLLILFFLWLLVSSLKNNLPLLKRELPKENILGFVLTVLLSVCFLFPNTVTIVSGGWHLITEREADAVSIQGSISDVQVVEAPWFPMMKDNYDKEKGHGYRIVVDGVEALAPAFVGMEVGDRVEVTYLPESGYILRIEVLSED